VHNISASGIRAKITPAAPLILTLSPVGRFRTIPPMWLADAASETV